MGIIVLGSLDTKGFECQRRVYDVRGLCPTIGCQQRGDGGVFILDVKSRTKNDQNQSQQLEGILRNGQRGGIDITYPDSKTRRARVQGGGHICPTLTTSGEIGIMNESNQEYRIRKLTPRECFRLMGVSDEDIDKMMSVNSNAQCYKQAGNSIVVPVLEAIFTRMFIDTEPIPGTQLDINDFL